MMDGEQPRPAPLLQSYHVALVIPRAGINADQVADVRQRLREIANVLPAEGQITLVVLGYDVQEPSKGIQKDVVDMSRASKVKLKWVGLRAKDGRTAANICMSKDVALCDEVWCCTAPAHTHNSKCRPSAVLRMGLRTEQPMRYKHIPAWVNPPVKPPAQTMIVKKGSRPW